MANTSQSAAAPPRVFISYSWDSTSHKAWVADLGGALRKDGIDVVLDKWHLHLGDPLPQFMETSVRESRFVLMVCTPAYKKKADERHGGAGYETGVITAELARDENQRKFIGILRAGTEERSIPTWLSGKNYVDLRKEAAFDDGYQDLLDTLLARVPPPPQIGSGLSTEQQEGRTPRIRPALLASFASAADTAVLKAEECLALETKNLPGIQLLLSPVKRDLENQYTKVDSLVREISLVGPEKLKKAAGAVLAAVLDARVACLVPPGIAASEYRKFETAMAAAKKEMRKAQIQFQEAAREAI